MRFNCPHCQQACRTRTSKRPTRELHKFYLECTNACCGWRGVAVSVFTATTSPSMQPEVSVRIPMEPRAARALVNQLVIDPHANKQIVDRLIARLGPTA